MNANSNKQGFLAEVDELVKRVECRRAVTAEDKEAIYRMRYRGYMKEGFAPADTPEIFKDEYDDMSNSCSIGLHIGDELVASIRCHVGNSAYPGIPLMHGWEDVVQPFFDRGHVVIDFSRFVVESQFSKLYGKLPFVTLRLAALLSLHVSADTAFAAIREEHMPFYKRYFQYKELSEPRMHGRLTKPVSLMGTDCKEFYANVLGKYPFLRSTEIERTEIFDDFGVEFRPSAIAA